MSVVTATILADGKAIDLGWELLSLEIVRVVNRIPYGQLVLADGDASEQVFEISDSSAFEPGKEVEIKLRYEEDGSSDVSVFKGPVTAQRVEACANGSSITVELRDAAVALTSARKSMVFENMTDDKAIKQVISDGGLKAGKIPATKATHEQLVQFYATAWDFVLARADSNGLMVVVNDGEVGLNEIKISGGPKEKFEYGISAIHDFEMQLDARHQLPKAEAAAWDVKTQKLSKPAAAADLALAQSNLKGKTLADTLKNEAATLTSAVGLPPEEVQAWADSTLARNRMAMLRGRISVPGTGTVLPGDVIEIAGVSTRFNGKTLVTGVRHLVDQNGWTTAIQFGMPPEEFSFTPDIVDAPAAGLLPAVNGLQIGKVVAFDPDPENELRVKVVVPGINGDEGIVWARLATPDGGAERGFFFRPEVDDEVVIGFFNDDPRYPVILGAMYGSKNTAPAIFGDPEEENINKGIVTRAGTILGFVDDEKAQVYIETPAGNKVLLDDDGEMIQLTDLNGNEVTLSADGVIIKSAKDFKVEASGNVEIKGTKVDIK